VDATDTLSMQDRLSNASEPYVRWAQEDVVPMLDTRSRFLQLVTPPALELSCRRGLQSGRRLHPFECRDAADPPSSKVGSESQSERRSHPADDSLASAVQAGLERLARPLTKRRALSLFRDDNGSVDR